VIDISKKKNYKYYTEVIGQHGPYTVKHASKASMTSYEKKLKQQYPYFRKIKSGKIPRVKKRKR